MSWSSVLGITAVIALLSFVVFSFRQGDKVRNEPKGTPQDRTGGSTPSDHGGGHSP